MAVPSNTFKTYEAVGVKEDLADIIKNISPVDTAFYSSLSEGGADQTKVEWQTDALAAADANAHLEGDDESPEAITPTARIYNMCQIQKKSFIISGTEEKVKKAGRKSEKDYQTVKKSKELSKDVEYAFLKGVRADGSASVVRTMRGILNWVTTNLDKAADATLNSDGTVTGGTARAFTEALLKATLQDVYTAGGNPTKAYLGVYQKGVVSGWSQETSNYRVPVDGKKLNAVIDVYMSDFGAVAFKVHRGMPADVVLLVDDAHKGKKATLRNTHREKLANTGDNEKWVVRVEHTLRDLAESAHGRITNLTTS